MSETTVRAVWPPCGMHASSPACSYERVRNGRAGSSRIQEVMSCLQDGGRRRVVLRSLAGCLLPRLFLCVGVIGDTLGGPCWGSPGDPLQGRTPSDGPPSSSLDVDVLSMYYWRFQCFLTVLLLLLSIEGSFPREAVSSESTDVTTWSAM